ncbi:MAG: GAF domain-containing protein [Anaerolineales bacterium]|nr:GAF domain-containing protein [Anaerolineales bacterium]
MRENLVPHYFSVYPTGHIPVPVCIGDLPLSDYSVSQSTLAEEVTSHLQNHISIPGVIIINDDRLIGVIPRHKMFERLGQRYGIELFLRKPIGELERELGAGVFILKSQLSINAAVRLALGRPGNSIYDPIIVEHEDGSLYLLDMYVLLLTQSQLSANLSGIISSLNNIETILASETAGASTLNLILESMNLVVPFHHARIVLEKQEDLGTLLITNEMVHLMEEPLKTNDIYRSILGMNQPLSLEDIRSVPIWKDTASPVNTRSWMGIPLSDQFGAIGLLVLSRVTLSPFTMNEKELAQVFARYINTLLINLSMRIKNNRFFEKIT